MRFMLFISKLLITIIVVTLLSNKAAYSVDYFSSFAPSYRASDVDVTLSYDSGVVRLVDGMTGNKLSYIRMRRLAYYAMLEEAMALIE